MSAVEEAVVETAEVVADTVEHVRPWKLNLNGTSKGQQIAILAGVFLVGAAIGSELTFKWTKKRLEEKYNDISRQEIEGAKQFYEARAAMYRKDKTPEEMLAELHENDPADIVVKAAEAHASYSGVTPPVGPVATEEELIEPSESPAVSTQSNIFSTPQPTPEELGLGWDYEAELRIRAENPDQPYVISEEEFLEGEREYETTALVYFEGDDTLADDKDVPVGNTDDVVGDDNLTRFGHGCKDVNRVYIRNDRLELDFEVVRSNGKYTVEVLGLDDPDENSLRHSHRPRKFRVDDD